MGMFLLGVGCTLFIEMAAVIIMAIKMNLKKAKPDGDERDWNG